MLDGTGNRKFGIAISPGDGWEEGGGLCIALEFENRRSLNRHLHPSNSRQSPFDRFIKRARSRVRHLNITGRWAVGLKNCNFLLSN